MNIDLCVSCVLSVAAAVGIIVTCSLGAQLALEAALEYDQWQRTLERLKELP